MDFNINLRFQPSGWFIGVLAELNEQYSDWTDGSYDWAAQTTDFLHNPVPLPEFDASLFKTPLSQRAVNDLLHVAMALMSGDFLAVRAYLAQIRFAFVIGYPRSGGSYMTKELLRTVGLDHMRVSEALAHDGFPELRDIWYDREGEKPYFHLQSSAFQTAEFLVIANFYYQIKTRRGGDGTWLAPKKMHKIIHWAGSFKMLLGQGRADYLVTLRHPLPTAISIAEKSGGLPENLRFPAAQPRSAIERWVLNDLMMLGMPEAEIAALSYFEAVQISWSLFHGRMASSGLFLSNRDEITLLPYGRDALEGAIRSYRARHATATPPEPLLIHDKAKAFPDWHAPTNAAVAQMSGYWRSLGLTFPELTLE
ncbi:hypothetical protein AB4874_08635 [Thioclava sp. 15-R06ZXC-3]|uniref:Sulfotransferase family protein n=1 Tax=Thioclava arctica TaxID=3238301 RepID=A0ABV3TJI5_9RHOB